MKTLHVPNQTIAQCETVFDKIKMMLKAGAEATIDQVNWKDEFPKSLPVTVRVAHDGDRLYLYYTVTGEEIRAVNTNDFGSVWEDSCVEFFMQREGESVYRNFECNALGVLLSRCNEGRGKGEPQTELMPSIFRYGTILHRYEGEKQVNDWTVHGSLSTISISAVRERQVTDWTMYIEIPKQALGFADHESLAGQKIRGNFYKCGDKTPEPHFLSWSPIDLPAPNFHVPEFFGLLELE